VAVTGGLTFTALAVGHDHTCGVATGGNAYCWGANYAGQLGNGSVDFSAVPGAVTGGLAFARLTAGNAYTCGLTTGGVAYCWGSNSNGKLGSGSTTNYSTVPVKVAGQP